MKTKLLVTFLLFSCSLVTLSQDDIADNTDEIRIKKISLVTELERQIKEVPFAAVRVRARYQLASWLWKEANDNTGRAEEIAAAAIDDYYVNKGEIGPSYSTVPQLFILVDSHAKDLAKRLREKYRTSLEDEAKRVPFLLQQKDGDKLAVDAVVSLLSGRNEASPDLLYLLTTLEQQESPHLNRLLTSILAADAAGRISFPTHVIEIFTGFFIRPAIPDDLRRRFIGLVVARSRNVAVMSQLDQIAYYRILQRLWPDICARYPELVGEAGTALALLNTRVSSSIREAHERHKRIQDSPDRLAATITEAEKADDDTVKYGLYESAARIALTRKRFVFAVDLMVKASEIRTARTLSEKEEASRLRIQDQFYRDVVAASLDANEPDAAHHAIENMHAPLSKAAGFQKISRYRIDRNDLDSARQTLDEAVKLISNVESSPEGIGILSQMLTTAHQIDSGRLSELGKLIAKKINAAPTLRVEDKSDTKEYRDYVTKVIAINDVLRSALIDLVKVNRSAADDLVGRIDKKEVRIIADFVISANLIDSLSKQKKDPRLAMSP